MEVINLKRGAEAWAERLMENKRHRLPDYGDVEVIIKENATANGQAGVMLTFNVDVKGKKRRVQTVMTSNNFLAAAAFLRAVTGGEDASLFDHITNIQQLNMHLTRDLDEAQKAYDRAAAEVESFKTEQAKLLSLVAELQQQLQWRKWPEDVPPMYEVALCRRGGALDSNEVWLDEGFEEWDEDDVIFWIPTSGIKRPDEAQS